MKKVVAPSCIEVYAAQNKSEPMFGDQGQQCFFRESVYPVVPWPRACKVYQANDVCNSYEISAEGNYVYSCELAMKAGECIPK